MQLLIILFWLVIYFNKEHKILISLLHYGIPSKLYNAETH